MLRLALLLALASLSLSLVVKQEAVFPFGAYETNAEVSRDLPKTFGIGRDWLSLLRVERATALQREGEYSYLPQVAITLEMRNIELGYGDDAQGNITVQGDAFKQCCGSNGERQAIFSWNIQCVEKGGEDGLFCRTVDLGQLRALCETPTSFSVVDLYQSPSSLSSSTADTQVALHNFCTLEGSLAFTCTVAGDCWRPAPPPTEASFVRMKVL